MRTAIRANWFARIIRNWNPYFYSASGRFARIIRISDSRESRDSRESCESIRSNHATKVTEPNLRFPAVFCENRRSIKPHKFLSRFPWTLRTTAEDVGRKLLCLKEGLWLCTWVESSVLPAWASDLRCPNWNSGAENWKATKEYQNQRGTKIRVFRVWFRAPFLPPFFPSLFPPSFPFRPCSLSHHFFPLHLPLYPPLFWLPEKSDLGTPLIWVLFSVRLRKGPTKPQNRTTSTLVLRSSSPATGFVWPLQALIAQKVRRWVRGALGPEGRKSRKKSQTRVQKVQR